MSDGPLFKDADEQEAIYAPEQLPAGTAGDAVAGDAGDEDVSTAAAPPVPGVAFEAAGAGTGAGESTGTAGTSGGMVPAVGAIALAHEAEADDDVAERSR